MMHEQLRQRTDIDYPAAFYKGYSQDGLDLTAIQEDIAHLERQADHLQRSLDQFND